MAAGQRDDQATQRVLVVDDDEVSRNLIANYLGRIGYPNVTLCEDGDAAWRELTSKPYDLIVLDWKLPKLSGMALFNRFRALPGHQTTPLLVVSGLLERSDFRLLQEFPCTALLEKPFTMGLFQARLEELTREAVWYGQNVALVDAILEAVKNDGKQAEQLLRQVLKKAPNPLPLALIAARRLVTHRLLAPAQRVLEAVLKVDEGSVIAMNEYGKVMHLLGRHEAALDVLRRATKLSPQNVQRLCLMGEVELNLQDPEAARASFEKALEIDAEATKAHAGVVVAGNMQDLLDGPEPLSVPRSFGSLLNTIGITLVRNGRYAKGIEQYRAALVFLHADDDSARVAFNLGLGFLRWGKPREALPWFRRSEAMAPEGFGKAAAYVRQLVMTNAGSVDQKLVEVDFVKATPPAGDAAAAQERRGTLHDDAESAEPAAAPLPTEDETPADISGDDDEIDEESVGTQVML